MPSNVATASSFKLSRLIVQIVFAPVVLIALVMLGIGSALLLAAERCVFGRNSASKLSSAQLQSVEHFARRRTV